MLHPTGGAELGLTRGHVRVVDSDPAWPAFFDHLAPGIRSALGHAAVAVEHIGSTAVPGLAAEPVLDIAIGLESTADVADVIPSLTWLGYVYRGDAGDDGGLIFVLEDRPDHEVARLHVVGHGSRRWNDDLAMRDRLRADAAARSAYAALKRELAAKHIHDRRAYTAAKTAFIARLLTGE